MSNLKKGEPGVSNLRRFPRVSTYKHARIESIEQEGIEPSISISGVVFEIGAQGCGVRSEGDLEPGTLVKVSLYDNSRLDPVVFRARVVWRGSIDGSHLKSYGMQFLKCDGGHKSAGVQEMDELLVGVGSKVHLGE